MPSTYNFQTTSEAPETGPLSVSDALEIAKIALESISLCVVGEISDLSDNPRYKAVYFTLSDGRSALPCIMWRSSFDRLGLELKSGVKVEVKGRFSLYADKGRMQFNVREISLAGEGQLRARVAALAAKLKAQGHMDADKKLPLPKLPEAIALVTSPRGKAVYDVLRTLKRRYPQARVLLFGVGVEGKDAPQNMIKALKAAEKSEAELVLLVRGGGSYEDLMPFNDEELALAIAALSKPVVTGIGHEPDTSIADMVASLRASTPTAAAEAVAPDKQELLAQLSSMLDKLTSAAQRNLEYLRHEQILLERSEVFTRRDYLFANKALDLEQTSMRLDTAIPHGLSTARAMLENQQRSLPDALERFLNNASQHLTQNSHALAYQGKSLTHQFNQTLATAAAQLESLSPLAVLSRGYSLSYNEKGQVLTSVKQVQEGQALKVRLKDGALYTQVSTIEEIKPKESS